MLLPRNVQPLAAFGMHICIDVPCSRMFVQSMPLLNALLSSDVMQTRFQTIHRWQTVQTYAHGKRSSWRQSLKYVWPKCGCCTHAHRMHAPTPILHVSARACDMCLCHVLWACMHVHNFAVVTHARMRIIKRQSTVYLQPNNTYAALYHFCVS